VRKGGVLRHDVSVARTRDPNDVVGAFASTVDSSLDVWQRTQVALAGSSMDLRKAVSLDAFVRVAVAWEVFRSDWHIAAINRDSSAYRASTVARFRASTRDGRFEQLEPYVQITWPAHLSVSTVRRLLDPRERNISFGDNWTVRAQTDLAAAYGSKVTGLSPTDLRMTAAAERLRNAIAHRSASSIDELNSALLVLDPLVDNHLVRTTRVTAQGLAAYLHADLGGERRVQAWHRRLREVAVRLMT
jgi:hypothetical protein